AQGFVQRPDVGPVRSKRGEEAFDEDGAGEAGGRDGSLQVVEEVAETTNLARDLAARILSAEVEEEDDAARRAAQRADDRDEQATPATHAADKAQAARTSGEEQTVSARDRDDRRDGHRHGETSPQIEDQTLVELRQAFASGREDDSMDMGI
ncbi:MAG: conjugal transfer protein TraD, partial [Sphingobium sp.]